MADEYELMRIADALTFLSLWQTQHYKEAQKILERIKVREAKRYDKGS